MFDFNHLQDVLHQLATQGISLEHLTFDQLADVLTHAGIDLSQLSAHDINSLIALVRGHEPTSDILPKAHDTIQEVSAPEIVRFGGFTCVEPLADLQGGPTCSHETIENLAQLAHPGLPNTFSDGLVKFTHGQALDPAWWKQILWGVGVPSDWYWFDHNVLIQALNMNHGVAIVGDAHYLNPAVYPPNSLHAFTLTNVWKDQSGNILGYKGIDSNYLGQEMFWPLQAVQQANEHGVDWAKKMFLTSVPLAWPFKTT